MSEGQDRRKPISRRTKGLVAGVVAAVLIASGVGYWIFARQSANQPAAVSLGPVAIASGATDSTGGTGTSGTWTVDGSQSFVGYRVREKLGFLPAPSDAVGRTSAVTGSMTITGTSVTAVTMSADLTQLKSNEARRDEHMADSGLETDRFPTATFTLTSPITFAQKPTKGETLKASATGDFTLHGVTKRITIPMQARWDGSTIEVVTSFPVQFSDYSITPPDFAGFVTVQDNGTVEMKLIFTK
jgi:polyisoprenoid-binding protein YceI